jgi:hypothetical protein
MTVATAPRTLARGRDLAVEQLVVAGGQVAAGVGNLTFSLLAARLLAPSGYSALASFLALYLVIHVPLTSLSAGAALRPGRVAAARRRTWKLGFAVAAGLAVAAVPLGAALRLPPALILLAAAAAPAAAPIALERGRLYGEQARGRLVASLLAEPAIRLGAGIPLAVSFGSVGGAAAVVLAGWVALGVARGGAGARPARGEAAVTQAPAVVAFLALAVVQNQDVLLAHALLPSAQAAKFAALSTLGGVAAFATTTIPLVLLPRSAGREGAALRAALAVAVALGAGATLVVLAAPHLLVTAVFGSRYGAIASLAAPYVGAMALLGVARVLVAHGCVGGRARVMPALAVAAAALQAVLIAVLPHNTAGVAHATLVATATLLVGTAVAVRPRRPPRLRPVVVEEKAPRPRKAPSVAIAVGVMVLCGVALRLVATRSIWVDEAISIHQAQLPFGEMLHNLRTTDVHPPLHDSVLWVTVRLLGTDPLAARMPSLLAGTALIPMLYVAGRDLYDRRTGLVAAALGTVAPFAIWYSDEARMYALFMLLALVAIWAQVQAVRDGRARFWALYALATIALVYDQYFAILLVVVQQVGFLAAAWHRRGDRRALRRLVRGWLGVTVVIAAALAPLVPFAQQQYGVNEAAGKGFSQPSQAGLATSGQHKPSLYGAITNAVWAFWGYHSNSTMASIAALWPLGMLLALLALGRKLTRTSLLVLACAVLPAAGLFAAGEAKPFVFEVRYFCAAVPALLLLAGRAVIAAGRTRWGRTALASALGATMLVGLIDQQVNGSNPRHYDFSGALHRIEREARPGDVLVYAPPYLADVIRYYAPRLDARPLVPGRTVRGHGRVFVLASFLDKRDTAAATGSVVAKLRQQRGRPTVFTVPQIRVWEFR